MHPLERRSRILELLETENFLTVERAQEELGISPATARRDFGILSSEMRVVRGRGGIHRLETAPVMALLPLGRHKVTNPESKDRIARAAMGILPASGVIIIDGGTTTAHLARYLGPSHRIITNSVGLAMALMQTSEERNQRLEVTITGGELHRNGGQLLGPQTIAALREFHGDYTLLGASGISASGVFNSSTLAAEAQREMMGCAKKVAVLLDQSKFDRTDMVRVCPLERINVVVTDAPPIGSLEAALREAGVEVIVA